MLTDTMTKSASDLFKIATVVAGFDAKELMLEIHRLQRGRDALANARTVEHAMGNIAAKAEGK